MTHSKKRLTPDEETALFLSQGFLFGPIDEQSLFNLDGLPQPIIGLWYAEVNQLMEDIKTSLIVTAANFSIVLYGVNTRASQSWEGVVRMDYTTLVSLSSKLRGLKREGGERLVEDIMHALNWAVYRHSIGSSQQ